MLNVTTPLAAASLMLSSAVAFADGHAACALTYDVYEYSVPHTDLAECPAGLGGEGQFCRLSLMVEVATVFVFDEESGCLTASKAYEEDAFELTLK